MKTNFDKITENIESLVDYIGYLIDKHDKEGGFIVSLDIKNSLKKTLPMDEQFTDNEIDYAFSKHEQGYEYIACNKNGMKTLFVSEPVRLTDRNWFDREDTHTVVPETMFKYLKWEDEPIRIIDIINSREEK